MTDLLEKALPTHTQPVLCIGRNLDAAVAELVPAVGDPDEITRLPMDESFDCKRLEAEDGTFGLIVLHRVLGHLDERDLAALLGECYRLLANRGRVVLTDQFPPYERLSGGVGRKLLGMFGVRYTSNEVYSLLERAGFWECLVLRKGGLDTAVVIRGDKVEQRASLDRHPTLQTNPTFQLIK